MTYYLEPTRPLALKPATNKPSPPWLARAIVALLGGAILFILGLSLLPTVYAFRYRGQIFPGVSVAGVPLAGLKPDEAAMLLSQNLLYPTQGHLYFKHGENIWEAKPGQVGIFIDYQSTAEAAYLQGRDGNPFTRLEQQITAWQSGVDLPPIMIYDESAALTYLQGIAAQIDRPVIEASLSINGSDVVVNAGQIGRYVDIPAALQAVRSQAPTLVDAIIPLAIDETPPIILDASTQAEIARKILSAPVTISIPDGLAGDPGPWTVDQKTLAGMLTIGRAQTTDGVQYQVGLNNELIRSFLEAIAPTMVRKPQDAHFSFDEENHQLILVQNAIIGRTLDISTSVNVINEKVIAGEHAIPLDMEYTNPAVTDDATAESLGIRELVSSYTSYFYGSGEARIQNIATASARFQGAMVAPGAAFSMAEVLGDVSLDSGYAEALIIFGDRTIKGVGGGVCQVSTTLFRTVFFGGYPVEERYAHAYRVSYYEQTAGGGYDSDLAGLDATVYAPVVDFKFTNNSAYWLLMETEVDAAARTLTWKFYSTSDGRSVEWNTTGPKNIVNPESPIYEENPALAKGEIKQVDWEAQGADVSVTRTVSRDNQVLFSDSFNTHYLPWRARYQYGPGTEGIPETQEPTPTPSP